MNRLEQIRRLIDQADMTMLRALAERMNLVEEVTRIKSEQGLKVFDAEREQMLFSNLSDKAKSLDLDIVLVENLLRQIVGYSRRIQNSYYSKHHCSSSSSVKSVSYQGTTGAHSWKAARKHFDSSPEMVGCSTFAKTIEKLVTGEVDRAFLPYRNSITGSIHEAYDLVVDNELHIVGEQHIHIDHCLVANMDAEFSQITDIYANPFALSQCGDFLANLADIDVHASVDTATALKELKSSPANNKAAIACDAAAEHFGMQVLKAGISDHPDNSTRFWEISSTPSSPSIDQEVKTSLVLVTEHYEGALVECLQIFAREGVNMLKLESRPLLRNMEQFEFFIDLAGSAEADSIKNTLSEINSKAIELRILGSYQSAE